MSNHLVSRPLLIPGSQTGQLEYIPNELQSVMQMGHMGSVSDNAALQQHSDPKQHMKLMGPVSKGFEVQKLLTLHDYVGQDQSTDKAVGSQRYMFSPKTLEVVNMLNNQGSPHSSVPSKRKAPIEPTGELSPRSSSFPLKRATQMEHRPWLVQPLGSGEVMPSQSLQQNPGAKRLLVQTKKLTQMESISPKSASQRVTPKSQTSGQSSGKGESFVSVRSKMRESLAAALDLVYQARSNAQTSVKNLQDEVLHMQGSAPGTQPSASKTNPANDDHPIEEPMVALVSSLESHDQNDGGSAIVSVSDMQDFQSENALSTDDVPFSDHFFVKDELLQGNGLSWVLDSDVGVRETGVNQPVERKSPVHEQVEKKEEVHHSPEELAFKIEVELYKLFGGVNKKYKEKGRSLLFNLKDRNNPELRERVVSGEITPERLCSMSAEELASKELSEWRMAKAEELAQMVVLLDSEVDVRRLVKKTHKGEFQVEVEQDDGVSVEVSLDGNSVSRSRLSMEEKESPHLKPNESKERNAQGGKTGTVNKESGYTLTIPSEGQESEVDMMDAAVGDLPPIVSLDEFMQSLDSEPPFQDLSVDCGKSGTHSPEKDLQAGSALESPERSPKVTDDAVPEKPSKMDGTLSTSDIDLTSSNSQEKPESGLSSIISKDEQVWEGHLQLNISTTVPVLGGFKSGEKTSAKQWGSVVEIKGRVKLDAFEKFLQDLRMSRSRAIMVVHFLCKDGSSDNERASICEVADSYVLDERVGFAEPSQGVELYFCPPHSRARDVLSKILSEDQTPPLDSVDSGLIGVVIWRRTQFTSSAAIKQHAAYKKQYVTTSTTKSRHPQDKLDPYETKPYHQSSQLSSAPKPPSYNVANVGDVDNDCDDDVPPGFGPAPGPSRDIDDLPEFRFAGGGSDPRAIQRLPPIGSQPSWVPSRPVDQIRELIHKYGQSRAEPTFGKPGIPMQPWNDDDDDIPEWQPQGTGQSFNAQVPQADMGNRRMGHQLTHDRVANLSDGKAATALSQHHRPASRSYSKSRDGQYYGPQRGGAAELRQHGHGSGGY